jgi:hypothetical protein
MLATSQRFPYAVQFFNSPKVQSTVIPLSSQAQLSLASLSAARQTIRVVQSSLAKSHQPHAA